MILSSLIRQRLGFATLAAIALAGTGTALAQETPPVVQAQALGELDAWSAAGAETGLERDLWAGTDQSLARTLLAQLEERPPTGAAAALAARILATGAGAPEGASGDGDLAAARLRALLALGRVEAVALALSRTPRVESSEPLSRLQAEAALWRGQDARACETAQALQTGREGAWWLKLRAYCQLVAGQATTAEVTFGLWRQTEDEDAAFERLFGLALAETQGGTGAMDSALSYALSRRLDASLPVGERTPRAALAVLAAGSGEARLDVAARAWRLGLIPAETLRNLYAPPEALGAEAITDAAGPPQAAPVEIAAVAAAPGAAGEAALYLIARSDADPARRLAAVEALIARADSPAEQTALAELTGPLIQPLLTEGAAPEEAFALAVAAALSGQSDLARSLARGLETTPFRLSVLQALIALNAPQGGTAALDQLVELGGTGSRAARLEAQAAAMIVAAAGVEMSPQARAAFATFDVARPETTPARLTALDMAGDAGRQGEAALLALSIVHQRGGDLPPADRAAVIRALARAGLVDDARALAREGLLAFLD